MPPSDLTLQLAALRHDGGRTVHYVPPTWQERAEYLSWVSACARAAHDANFEPQQAPTGFTANRLAETALWLLHEQPQHRRGAGALVLRTGSACPLLVEAPHTLFESGTLPIALGLFERIHARSLGVNTVHRASTARASSPALRAHAARRGTLASDVAHRPEAFFSAAHEALLAGLGPLPALQIHGFRDEREPRFDVVLSDSRSGCDLTRLVAALQLRSPELRIAVFPRDTAELGGVRNAQARASRAAGAPFVHVELARSLRQRLTQSRGALDAFASAFAVLANAE